MTHRERVLKALNYGEPDRVPVDFGGSRDSSIVKEGYEALARHLDLQIKEVTFVSRVMRAVRVDDHVLEYFDVDTRGIYLAPPDIGGDVYLDDHTYRDEWGVVRSKPNGGFYYDQRESPLRGALTIGEIANYAWPDPRDPGRFRTLQHQIDQVKSNGDYAIVLNLQPAFVQTSQFLRGYKDWYIDSVRSRKTLEVLFDAILEINLEIAELAISKVGNQVDIVFVSDDLGGQNSLQFSPRFFKASVKPRLARYFELIHKLAPAAKLAFHSCGSIEPIIADLIDIGVDVLNPIQVDAAGMDTALLKEKYGERLCFWGAIDAHCMLGKGNIEEVKKEVELRINHLSTRGGFILSVDHNIQPDVPPENVVLMYEHARAYSNARRN